MRESGCSFETEVTLDAAVKTTKVGQMAGTNDFESLAPVLITQP